MLFSTDHLTGIPGPDGSLPPATTSAKLQIDEGLKILTAAADAGKIIMGESPVSRGKGSAFAFKESIYAKHCSQWQYPPMADYLNTFDIKPVYSDQGAAGGTHTKTTEMRVSSAGFRYAQHELGTLRVNGFQTHQSPSVVGSDGDYGKASHLERYPIEFSRRIARVILSAVDILTVSNPTM